MKKIQTQLSPAPRLRPAARALNTFVTPTLKQPSNAQRLAKTLGALGNVAGGYAAQGMAKEQAEELQKQAGRRIETEAELQKALAEGHVSWWKRGPSREGLYQARARTAAAQYDAGFREAANAHPELTSSANGANDILAFQRDYRRNYLKENAFSPGVKKYLLGHMNEVESRHTRSLMTTRDAKAFQELKQDSSDTCAAILQGRGTDRLQTAQALGAQTAKNINVFGDVVANKMARDHIYAQVIGAPSMADAEEIRKIVKLIPGGEGSLMVNTTQGKILMANIDRFLNKKAVEDDQKELRAETLTKMRMGKEFSAYYGKRIAEGAKPGDIADEFIAKNPGYRAFILSRTQVFVSGVQTKLTAENQVKHRRAKAAADTLPDDPTPDDIEKMESTLSDATTLRMARGIVSERAKAKIAAYKTRESDLGVYSANLMRIHESRQEKNVDYEKYDNNTRMMIREDVENGLLTHADGKHLLTELQRRGASQGKESGEFAAKSEIIRMARTYMAQMTQLGEEINIGLPKKAVETFDAAFQKYGKDNGFAAANANAGQILQGVIDNSFPEWKADVRPVPADQRAAQRESVADAESKAKKEASYTNSILLCAAKNKRLYLADIRDATKTKETGVKYPPIDMFILRRAMLQGKKWGWMFPIDRRDLENATAKELNAMLGPDDHKRWGVVRAKKMRALRILMTVNASRPQENKLPAKEMQQVKDEYRLLQNTSSPSDLLPDDWPLWAKTQFNDMLRETLPGDYGLRMSPTEAMSHPKGALRAMAKRGVAFFNTQNEFLNAYAKYLSKTKNPLSDIFAHLGITDKIAQQSFALQQWQALDGEDTPDKWMLDREKEKTKNAR